MLILSLTDYYSTHVIYNYSKYYKNTNTHINLVVSINYLSDSYLFLFYTKIYNLSVNPPADIEISRKRHQFDAIAKWNL